VALAEDYKTIHFVIPPRPANADGLLDEDLEKVAGDIDAATILVLGGLALTTSRVLGVAATQMNHGW
jgi:hypothetical protein